ncbi:MAG: HAD family hydrolase [Planctomycetes bacterium]|nr:HAD family hydrolase [Planctomycetota bacterium]
MSDAAAPLRQFQPKHGFLVGIDSDGCAFDTMELKHKECFIPAIIAHWGLQAVSKYAREAAEFVNLYSKFRGVNRFPALTKAFDLLAERPEVRRRGVEMPEVPSLRAWIARETKLGNPALEAEAKKTGDPVLARALAWSKDVNTAVAKIVGRGIPPFPFVRESLAKLDGRADMIVVSATPCEALKREWEEQDLARYAAVIAGQEMGSKKEHLALASAGRHEPDRILMIGDAPGDLKAAKANGALFYPIFPGEEDASWQRFHEEAAGKFLDGTYAGAYQETLIAEFDQKLPETPPWKR